MKWIRHNSLRALESKLAALDVFLSHVSLRRILKQEKYSLKANRKSVTLTHVYVGTSGNTSEFADDAIVRWFERQDRPRFQDERKILILCDGGGSNGYRVRNWKWQLQTQLADRFGVEVMICHYPIGASKWNPIEHRLFSFISLNWAGKPLRSLSRMTALIRGTVTRAGLKVKAPLLKGNYPLKIKVSNEDMDRITITRRKICQQWNYVIHPRSSDRSEP